MGWISLYCAILLACGLLISAERTCFSMEYAGLRSKQASEYVVIDIEFANTTYCKVNVQLKQSYINPTWKIVVTRSGPNFKSVQLLNTTNRVCEMARLGRRNPFVHAFVASVSALSNFTLECPISSGAYYAHFDLNLVRKFFPVRMLYQPNSSIRVGFVFYEQSSKGNFTYLAEFFIRFIIMSRKC